jgi:type II secretory pathway pseudopilin PulG
MIEVLAAMLVLCIGLLALAPMMVISITGNQHARDLTAVIAEVQSCIDQRFAQGDLGPLPSTEIDSASSSGHYITTTITDNSVDSTLPSNVYVIQTVIAWTDESGLTRSVDFTSYHAKPES